jgi:hypothetical protein
MFGFLFLASIAGFAHDLQGQAVSPAGTFDSQVA